MDMIYRITSTHPKAATHFKVIPFAPRYRINPLGQVLSYTKSNPVVMTPFLRAGGYQVSLRISKGVSQEIFVGRLLLYTYCPIEDPHLYTAVPINGEYSDLRLENWQWVPWTGGGVKRKLSQAQVDKIRDLYQKFPNMKLRAIAKKFEVSTSTIHDITSGKTWKKRRK